MLPLKSPSISPSLSPVSAANPLIRRGPRCATSCFDDLGKKKQQQNDNRYQEERDKRKKTVRRCMCSARAACLCSEMQSSWSFLLLSPVFTSSHQLLQVKEGKAPCVASIFFFFRDSFFVAAAPSPCLFPSLVEADHRGWQTAACADAASLAVLTRASE
jgi:hypothetical protein